MVDFEVEMIGDKPNDIQRRLSDINMNAKRRTNSALMDTARDVKDDLVETSPVDTGDYRSSWYIMQVDYNEVWILSNSEIADHNEYVMLPNSRMVGSSNADLPSQGILHNVKGVARKHQDNLRMNMSQHFEKMIQRFRSR